MGPGPAEPPARQKVHRSCTGLSLLKPLPAEASGFCVGRLESSPFKLFLHTGHVSCCERKEGGGKGCWGSVPLDAGARRGDGAALTSSNQGTMQLLWKKWLQGSCRTCSASA